MHAITGEKELASVSLLSISLHVTNDVFLYEVITLVLPNSPAR